jgi:ankyrin repeat protein
MFACAFATPKMCELLLSAGANPYDRCGIGNDALQLAAVMNNVATTEFWISKFPNWDFERANYALGGKVLTTAAFMARKFMVNRLIVAGANPFSTQETGATLLSSLAANEDCELELLQSLSERFPSLINQRRRSSTTKLKTITSIMKFMYRIGVRTPVVKLFALEAGDVPLSHAIRRGDRRAVEILLKAGADPQIKTDLQMDALDLCDHYGPFPEIRKLLV